MKELELAKAATDKASFTNKILVEKLKIKTQHIKNNLLGFNSLITRIDLHSGDRK